MAVGLGEYNLDAVRELDCRQYLREAPELSIAGEPVAPSTDSAVGGVKYGRLDAADVSRRDSDIRRVFG